MKIPKFDSIRLLEILFSQNWQRECEIIPDYKARFDDSNKTRVVVKYPNEFEDVFLRYSAGPQQGYFWDVYGDDMLSVELAIYALHMAPVPLNYKKLETHIKFTIGPKEVNA